MTSDGGKCHNLTPPIPDLLTNSKPPKHRIKVICMGVSFLAHDLADAVMRRAGMNVGKRVMPAPHCTDDE